MASRAEKPKPRQAYMPDLPRRPKPTAPQRTPEDVEFGSFMAALRQEESRLRGLSSRAYRADCPAAGRALDKAAEEVSFVREVEQTARRGLTYEAAEAAVRLTRVGRR
jgi:hypothetical protein